MMSLMIFNVRVTQNADASSDFICFISFTSDIPDDFPTFKIFYWMIGIGRHRRPAEARATNTSKWLPMFACKCLLRSLS